jgi:hypothetical protein
MTTKKITELSRLIKMGATVQQAIEQLIEWHPLEKRECPISVEEYRELVLEGIKHY